MISFNDLLFRNKRLKKCIEYFTIEDVKYEVTYFKNRGIFYYLYDDFDNGTYLKVYPNELFDLVKQVHFEKKEIYGIQKYYDKILPDVFDGYAYHVSDLKNRESILRDGLFPNGQLSMEVMMASCFLDAKKPKHIPPNFYRQMSVYVSPEKSYYFLKEYDNNVDLYIIDISKYDWRIASEGISGFCLAYWDDDKFEYPSEWRKYRKLYWDNCFSKEEYLSQSEKVKKSDDVYGLDEILIQNFISPDDIIQIGTFKDKHFYYQDVIKKFALNNFYNDFEKAE